MIALILAAGAGRRAGGPKALLPWGSTTLFEAHVRAALAAGCQCGIGVVRESVAHGLSGVMDALRAADAVRLVVSTEDDALGPAGSLAAFVAQSPDIDMLIAVAPVDVLPAAWAVVPALRDALNAQASAQAARPTHTGRGGHPVVVRARVLDRYRSPNPPPLRDVLHALDGGLLNVEVALPAVLGDMDTPEEVARHAPQD